MEQTYDIKTICIKHKRVGIVLWHFSCPANKYIPYFITLYHDDLFCEVRCNRTESNVAGYKKNRRCKVVCDAMPQNSNDP
jgi:hypothetical protein